MLRHPILGLAGLASLALCLPSCSWMLEVHDYDSQRDYYAEDVGRGIALMSERCDLLTCYGPSGELVRYLYVTDSRICDVVSPLAGSGVIEPMEFEEIEDKRYALSLHADDGIEIRIDLYRSLDAITYKLYKNLTMATMKTVEQRYRIDRSVGERMYEIASRMLADTLSKVNNSKELRLS